MNSKVSAGARILMGLIFTIFGINGLIMIATGSGFIPMPPPSPEMGQVMGGFFAAKYLMPLVKILEVLAGLMLLRGCMVNLALILIAPIVVNILGIHLFVDQGGLPMALALTVMFFILFLDKKEHFITFFKA